MADEHAELAELQALVCPRRLGAPEIAKLAMFMHYFVRMEKAEQAGERLRWSLVIDRVVNAALKEEAWLASRRLLQQLEVLASDKGCEQLPGDLAHADFANMYIGGCVFWGGCVQEEIRSSMCPDLCATPLVVRLVLQPEEALQVVGAERFSLCHGYGFKLRFAGDFRDGAAQWSPASWRWTRRTSVDVTTAWVRS